MPPIPTSSSRVPRVSVVMPCHNREKDISAAIDSVIAQDYDDFEIIVVDDRSTDRSREVVEGYGDQLRLIRREVNGGAAAARNTGIAAARGEFLAYCDSDDIQLPFRVRSQVELLEQSPNVAMVFSDFKTYMNGQIRGESHLRARCLGPTNRGFEKEIQAAFGVPKTCRERGLSVPDEYVGRSIYQGRVAPLIALMHVAWGCVQMSRTEAVREVGGHWEMLRSAEDWFLSGELSKKHDLIFMDLPTILYRVHQQQLTGRPRPNTECMLAVVLRLWGSDPAFRGTYPELTDFIVGTAYANLAEVDAAEEKWRDAERNFRQALSAWPKLKRAWPNVILAATRSRVPLFAGSFIDRALPRYVEPGQADRGE